MTAEPRAVFRHFLIRRRLGFPVVALIDYNTGLSITNDAENVIAWLYDNKILRNGNRVVYRDSQGRWDELQHDCNGKFVGFKLIGAQSAQEAVEKLS